MSRIHCIRCGQYKIEQKGDELICPTCHHRFKIVDANTEGCISCKLKDQYIIRLEHAIKRKLFAESEQ